MSGHPRRLREHTAVLLRNSQGLQKWLAAFGTDMHMVARAIDVCIPGQPFHKQKKVIM
jgi:hypothetical protein